METQLPPRNAAQQPPTFRPSLLWHGRPSQQLRSSCIAYWKWLLRRVVFWRTDGKDTLKSYTNPVFFFELWCSEIQKEVEKKRPAGKKVRVCEWYCVMHWCLCVHPHISLSFGSSSCHHWWSGILSLAPLMHPKLWTYLWPPCIAGCGHIYFHPVVSTFFLFPCLISAVGHWMFTIFPHMVWP